MSELWNKGNVAGVYHLSRVIRREESWRLETPAGSKPSVPAEGFGRLPKSKEEFLKH